MIPLEKIVNLEYARQWLADEDERNVSPGFYLLSCRRYPANLAELIATVPCRSTEVSPRWILILCPRMSDYTIKSIHVCDSNSIQTDLKDENLDMFLARSEYVSWHISLR